MKWSDVFAIPFVNWTPPWIVLWISYVLLTFFPGILLSILSLGTFRYFHLSKKFCGWLVDKDMKRADYDWYEEKK